MLQRWTLLGQHQNGKNGALVGVADEPIPSGVRVRIGTTAQPFDLWDYFQCKTTVKIVQMRELPWQPQRLELKSVCASPELQSLLCTVILPDLRLTFPSLKHLACPHWYDVPIEHLFSVLPSLASLDIGSLHLVESDPSEPGERTIDFHRMKRLVIRSIDARVEAFINTNLTKLETLEWLQSDTLTTPDSFIPAFEGLRFLKRLSLLRVRNIDTLLWQNAGSLVFLSLLEGLVDDSALEAIAVCRKLRSLRLGSQVQVTQPQQLINIIESRLVAIDDLRLPFLFRSAALFSRLRVLRATGSFVEEDLLASTSSDRLVLSNLQKLQELTLDKSGKPLQLVVGNCPSLERVTVSNFASLLVTHVALLDEIALSTRISSIQDLQIHSDSCRFLSLECTSMAEDSDHTHFDENSATVAIACINIQHLCIDARVLSGAKFMSNLSAYHQNLKKLTVTGNSVSLMANSGALFRRLQAFQSLEHISISRFAMSDLRIAIVPWEFYDRPIRSVRQCVVKTDSPLVSNGALSSATSDGFEKLDDTILLMSFFLKIFPSAQTIFINGVSQPVRSFNAAASQQQPSSSKGNPPATKSKNPILKLTLRSGNNVQNIELRKDLATICRLARGYQMIRIR